MKANTNQLEVNTLRNTKHLALWTGAWVITMAVVAFGPKLIWNFNNYISTFFILLNTLVGVGMILSNRKYINGLDEMQRKIHTDAMAIALGAGIVGGLSYSMLDIANVISPDAEIGFLVMFMGITYLVAIVIGNIRYK
ncbi:MAG: hypothetical protein AAF551_10690 [Bacteroidota bacterium]